MKFTTLAIAALSAATTQAVAVAYAEANPSPEAWCLFKGEGCWKVKRAAEAFSSAITSSGGIKESRAAEVSNHRGGAAYNAKRSIDELAALVASAYPDSDTFYKTLGLYEQFAADSRLNETHSTDISARDAESEETKRWCLFKGEGCWKREAAPWCLFKGEGCWKRSVPMTPREAEADPWCLFKGEGCWKRAEDNTAVDKREAAPAFCPFGGEAGNTCYASKRDFVEADKRSCEQPGEACYKARRAAEALIGAIETAEPSKRDVDVAARWCLFKGEGCWKRDGMDEVVARCNGPNGACTAARRDLAGMHAAARSLLESLDEQ
ncbi:Clock-controlled pheromone ccg-4 [Cytospora mali]|uniref:Clock-controlled pheromone ccg-4 n=1 Tax=Cytospora mali TaxID=578113 RepID=A0A194VP94_CYTMA|nr:Clock-controlled pheromone ccg-4 [Valsa mali]